MEFYKSSKQRQEKFSYHYHLIIFQVGESEEKDNSFNTTNIIML